MTDWIKASNPTASITDEADATAAARASAMAIFLGVLWSIVGIVYLMTGGQPVMEAAIAQASAENPEAAGMMARGVLWLSIGFVVVQLVLGLVQWARPNIMIPIVFAILIAFGLISGLSGMMMAGRDGMPGASATPAWQLWGGMVVMVVQLVLHTAGIRGARKLERLRYEAAQ